MNRRLWAWLLGFTAASSAFTHSRAALADVRYVGGPGASDDNGGSAQAPFATLQKAAAEAAAGDTFRVRSGVYSMFYIGNGGVSEALRVTFERDAGTASAPVIDGGVTVAADFVTIDGFEIRGAAMMGVNVYGASNLELVNNAIHDNQRGGVYAQPAQGRAADDIVVASNRIYRNSLDNSARTTQGGWAGAVQMFDANRMLVENNQVYENWGEGISFTVTQGSAARHNVVRDNYSVGLYMDHAIDCVFDGNLVFETDNREFFRNLNGAWPANGIQISNEPGYAISTPGRGNEIVNNIVIGGRAGFFYWRADGDDSGLRDTLVAHNTFYGAREMLLKIDQNAHQASRFVNNLFVSAGGTVVAGDTGGLQFEHNGWSTGQGVAGTGDVTGDCRLAKPGGHLAEDYRIANDSPCVGAGVSLPAVTQDYFGGSRAGRADIGAHQFGSTPASMPGGAGGRGGEPGGSGGTTAVGTSGSGGAMLVSGGKPASPEPVAGGTTSAAGNGAAESDADAPFRDDASCACRTDASRADAYPASLAGVLLASLFARRRRQLRSVRWPG